MGQHILDFVGQWMLFDLNASKRIYPSPVESVYNVKVLRTRHKIVFLRLYTIGRYAEVFFFPSLFFSYMILESMGGHIELCNHNPAWKS